MHGNAGTLTWDDPPPAGSPAPRLHEGRTHAADDCILSLLRGRRLKPGAPAQGARPPPGMTGTQPGDAG